MQKRISAADTVAIRVVLVTMDTHLATAAASVRAALRREIPGLDLVIHAAAEWLGDAEALEACRADIAQGDIVLVTMLFLEDHIRAVLPALAARRAECDAMLCCMSAGEVTRLTRLGRFDMTQQPSGPLALLRKLRGRRAPGAAAASGRSEMTMLRQLPRLMKFIPGTAQDVRAFFLAIQYWLAGSEANLGNLVRMMIDRYADGDRRVLRGTLAVDGPVVYPDVGLYHPRIPGRFAERVERLPGTGSAGTVGLLLLRSYLLAANTAHYDGMIAALEARGLRVVPAFASGLDSRPAIERFFLRNGRPCVDAVLSLTGFSLVGGPAYNDSHAAEALLATLDVPYLAAQALEFQTLEQWRADARGLLPVEATMMVAIPELDGATVPTVFGGRASGGAGERKRDMEVDPARAAMLAARLARIVALRRKARAARRLAIVLFNFPPNAGAAGTAAYLAVFESLHNTLAGLREAGYAVDLPPDAAALRARILEGNAALHGTDANVAARIPADAHVRGQPWLEEIERQWGPAPGRHQSDGSALLVLGAQFGNVFVGLQPAFGFEGDPMRLLFERGFAPTHAFAAFYRWIRDGFGADAVLHFGTHGALEFMPGKQTGLSDECWPDRLIGDLPNFYFYASNNPSEGMLAKRRAAAVLLSYLTPSVARAGLYRGLLELRTTLDRWRGLDPDADAAQRDALATLLQAQAAAVALAEAEPPWADRTAETERLTAALFELETTLIPHGLHVIGAPPDAAARADMLDAAGIDDPPRRAALDALLAQDHEIPALLHALDGGYVRPAPGGDLMRNPDVLPTGRNLHGFDPFRMPSAFALADGARQAARLLARHAADGKGLPETVAMVLWGTDNLKTEGGPIAQALWLMGATARFDTYGRLAGARLIDLAELGRPRIDVVLTLSGIFRDLLPLQVRLLAEAALLAAEADEPPECNMIRKHALAFQAAQGGDLARAALRVFGNAEGAYGANVNQLVGSGVWNDEDEIAEAFVRRKGFAYGADGRAGAERAVLAHLLADVGATYQNLDSIELGVTSVDHYFDTLGGISRAVRRARGGSAASVYIGDQTRGDGVVRTIAEQVALETRTRALNPKWYEALLKHGYEGVREIDACVTNTLGWSATTGEVSPWVYQQLAETYLLDETMRERLAALNPKASARIANRLIEAEARHYWSPDPATLEALRRAGEALEDRLEGIGMEMAA